MTQRDLNKWYARIAAKAAERGWRDPYVRRELRSLWHAEDSFGAYAQAKPWARRLRAPVAAGQRMYRTTPATASIRRAAALLGSD